MTSSASMSPPYARGTVRAALKRARAEGYELNRAQLHEETLLGLDEINRLISQVTQELDSAPPHGADGGAEDRERSNRPDQEANPGPFASPTYPDARP